MNFIKLFKNIDFLLARRDKIKLYLIFLGMIFASILELIGIDYLKNKEDYEINLMFNNNAHISLKSETIEVRLEDQTGLDND